MANLGFQFNAYEVDPSQAASSLPVSDSSGWPVIIKASEPKPCKDPESGMLEMTLEIFDGPMKGVTGAYRLNLWNKNQQAVEIAHKQLSALCHVTGQYMISDSAQLHNIPFRVLVRKQKDSDYTEVYGVLDINGNQPGKAGAPAPGAQPAGAAPTWPGAGAQAQPAQQSQPTQWAQPQPEQTAPPAPPAPAWQPGSTAPPAKPPWQK